MTRFTEELLVAELVVTVFVDGRATLRASGFFHGKPPPSRWIGEEVESPFNNNAGMIGFQYF